MESISVRGLEASAPDAAEASAAGGGAGQAPPRALPSSLLQRFEALRARTLALAAPLSAEDQVVQSMPDASPTKWHLAHTTWFFETMILGESEGYAPFNPAYGYLFNSYYEALGPRQPRNLRGLLTRPSLDDVLAYRAHVDQAMRHRLHAGALSHEALARVVLGLAHEEQHQELLLTDVLHLLSCSPLGPAYDFDWPRLDPVAPGVASFVPFSGGLVSTGTEVADGIDGPLAFDNEGPPHQVWLEPFGLADRLVSNADWLSFIADGGYRRPELWLSDGWAQVRAEQWTAPLYWVAGSEPRDVFGPRGREPLDPDAPVQHVSFYEAEAFARWSGRRLPTEAEWALAAQSRPEAFEQLFGAVWQWTASPYTPYPRFQPAAGALGEYNGKFMVNQMVLRGSSWATSPGHSRVSYRNFFQPHQRWQATGVRLTADAATLERAG